MTNKYEIITPEKVDKITKMGNDPKMEFANTLKDGTPGMQQRRAQEKRDYIVNLHLMGISADSILRQVNKSAKTKGWKPYKNTQGIKSALTQHFRTYNNPSESESNEYVAGLKEAAFSQQEHISETVSVYIQKRDKKNDWKPFEKVAALKELYLMRQQMVDNRNFNASKFNPNSEPVVNNTQVNIFLNNSRSMGLGQVTSPTLSAFKQKLLDKYTKKDNE